MSKRARVSLAGLLVCMVGPVAHAQWAVIDVDAIAQLVQQVQQLQQEYQSITGSRGMQSLAGGTSWNYLSSSWPQVAGTLATPILSTVSANAVLTSAQVALLSPALQQQLSAARNNAALLQAATADAYATTSSRFASVQQLIDAIASATDQKGILDLQARIQGELGMLQNESTKLNVLYQAAEGQEWARRQRMREQAVADLGSLRPLPALRLP